MTDNEKILNQLGTINEQLKTLIDHRLDHENRIRSLEIMAAQAQGGWKIIIALAAISSAVGGIVGWAAAHIK